MSKNNTTIIIVEPFDFFKGVRKSQKNIHHRQAKANGGKLSRKNEIEISIGMHRAWERLIYDATNGKPLTPSKALNQVIKIYTFFEIMFVVPTTGRVMSFEECVQMVNRHINRKTRFVPRGGFKNITLKVPRSQAHRSAFKNFLRDKKKGRIKIDTQECAKKFSVFYSIMMLFYVNDNGTFKILEDVLFEIGHLLDHSFKINIKYCKNMRKQELVRIGAI